MNCKYAHTEAEIAYMELFHTITPAFLRAYQQGRRLHPDYHRATDTPEKIDYKEIQVVSKTVAAVAWVLGNQAGRPRLKATLPDQLVKDMKTVKDQGWGKLTPVLPPLPGEPY